MALTSVLDVDELLAPLSDEGPSGRSLAYEPEYDELREARRSEEEVPQGEWRRRVKVADWERVIELGGDLLRRETKDLQIAAWMTEALTRRHGFAGLRDGLRLFLGIQETFWETYHPRIEDGDLESRLGPFLFLNSVLPAAVRVIPLTAGLGPEGYSFLRWQESRATDNAGLKDRDLMEALIAEGKITSQQFDDEVASTPRAFFEAIVDDLLRCLATLKEIDRSTDRRFGREAPSLVNLRKALDDCRQPLEPILAAKRAQEPDAEPEPDVEPEPGPDVEPEPEPEPGWDGPAANGDAAGARPRRASATPRPSGGPIADAEDARRRILDAAAYLREHDPGSPVPFLVVRALRMGEVYGAPRPLDASLLEPPTSAARQALKRLAGEGAWAELLEQAEQAIGRPEGRAWLDLQRYALAAMSAAAEPDRTAVVAAVRGLLRAFLDDFPDLPDAELGDGTPAANAETRAWLRDEVRAAPGPAPGPAACAPTPAESSPPDACEAGEDDPDAWDRALALARSGRAAEGIPLLRRALRAAATGRERFLRTLQMAELCLMAGHQRVALPLAEDLARQVDEFRLEQWEDEQLSARAWAALYRCLRGLPAGDDGAGDRLRQVFARLCRLDINQALSFGDGPVPPRVGRNPAAGPEND